MLRLLLMIASVGLLFGRVDPAWADGSLARVIKAGQLRICAALIAPWVLKTADGVLGGYDVDLASAIAADIGVKPKYVLKPFTELLPTLEKGECDIVASGLAITGPRALRAVFSTSTGAVDVRVVAAIASLGADPVASLAKPGATISVLAGSTDEAAARATFPKADVIAYASYSEALAALIGGKVEAMTATEPVPQMVETLFGAKFRQIGRPLVRTAEAFALAPDDVRLQSFVNNWIAAREADGFLDQARAHWFDRFDWVAASESAATLDTPAAARP